MHAGQALDTVTVTTFVTPQQHLQHPACLCPSATPIARRYRIHRAVRTRSTLVFRNDLDLLAGVNYEDGANGQNHALGVDDQNNKGYASQIWLC